MRTRVQARARARDASERRMIVEQSTNRYIPFLEYAKEWKNGARNLIDNDTHYQRNHHVSFNARELGDIHNASFRDKAPTDFLFKDLTENPIGDSL